MTITELEEGKTFKDSKYNKKNDKWARIKAEREAKQKDKEVEETEDFELSALDLVQSVIDQKPGNFKTIFEQLMHDRQVNVVGQRKVELATDLFGAPETPDEVEDDEKLEDDEDIEEGESELAGLDKSNPNPGGNRDAGGQTKGDNPLADEEDTGPSNTKAHQNPVKGGNSEKKEHMLATLARLRKISAAGKNVNTPPGSA